MEDVWIDWYKDKLGDVFTEEQFAGFRCFCDVNNISYMFQLKGFDFFSLCNVGGFEFSDVVAIIERWNDYAGKEPRWDEKKQQTALIQLGSEETKLSTMMIERELDENNIDKQLLREERLFTQANDLKKLDVEECPNTPHGSRVDIIIPEPRGEVLSLAGDALLMHVENKSIKVDEQTRKTVAVAKDLIVQVFQERTHFLFLDYCQKNNMIFMKDLLDFDYNVLLNINGFGKKKLRLVKDKWLWYLNLLKEHRHEINCQINTETSKEDVETITDWRKTVKSLSFNVERDLVWQAVSETIGEEMMQFIFVKGNLKRERMRLTERIEEAAFTFMENQGVHLVDEYASLVLKETLKRISILHIGDDIPRLIKERGLAKSGIVDIVSMLQDFVANVEEINQVTEVLQDASKKVHPDNFPLGVTCLKTLEVSDEIILWLKSQGLYTIRDVCQINQALIRQLTGTERLRLNMVGTCLKNVTFDLGERFWCSFRNLFTKDERAYNILVLRSQGETLEQVGGYYGITRERVRQIEAKTIKRLEWFLTLQMNYIISRAGNDKVLNFNDFRNMLGNGNEVRVVAYIFKNVEFPRLIYFEELDIFLIDIDADQMRWKLNTIIDEHIPDIWKPNEGREKIEGLLVEEGIVFGFDLFIKYLVATGFRVYGNTICRKGLTRSDIYRYVIAKYYGEGIRVYDENEVQKLKELIAEGFGEIELPDNDRAIAARITDFCILCGRGTYILPEYVCISDELLQEMRQYIVDTPRENIFVADIFERFKEKLSACGNVGNEYFLYGVLKYHFEGEFTFFRDTVSKTGAIVGNAYRELEDYMLSKGETVSKSELREAFPGISDIKINSALMYSNNIIYWDTNCYANIQIFDLSPAVRRNLQAVLERLFEEHDDYTNMNLAFGEIRRTMPNFVRDNGIRTPANLYCLLEYLFKRIYVFNRPHIWRELPEGGITTAGMIMRFIRKRGGMITDAVLNEWISNYCLSISTIKMVLTGLIDDQLLQLDVDEYIVADDSRFNEALVEGVKRELEIQMAGKEFLVLRDIDDFDYFPHIQGILWTQYLVQSIVRKFIKDFRIIDKGFPDRRFVDAAIVYNESPIQDLAGLVEHIVRQEFAGISDLTVEHLAEQLKNRKIIYKEIPQIVFTTSRLCVDEGGRVELNDWL